MGGGRVRPPGTEELAAFLSLYSLSVCLIARRSLTSSLGPLIRIKFSLSTVLLLPLPILPSPPYTTTPPPNPSTITPFY